jgi:ABC-2 type transport system permease protein
MVSIERAAGWSRQLRITPLRPAAYIVTKMLSALVLGLCSVLAVYIVGAITGKPSMPLHIWVITAACLWIGSLLFAAFGLFIGYLLPSENVMQIIAFALMLFSFGAGVFIPLSQFSPTLRTLAQYSPLYGLSQLVHYPLDGGSLRPSWVINLLVWLVIFVAGAAWRFRRDTARV